MTRIKKAEIESAIEGFVNCFYGFPNSENGWLKASYDEWLNAVYSELANWKTEHSDGGACSYQSNENRFEGKENIIQKIKPVLTKRLKELKAQGYKISAI